MVETLFTYGTPKKQRANRRLRRTVLPFAIASRRVILPSYTRPRMESRMDVFGPAVCVSTLSFPPEAQSFQAPLAVKSVDQGELYNLLLTLAIACL